MSQSSVNIEEVDVCKCGYYCRLKTSRTPLNPGRRFFGCKASKENGGCGYFRWIDPSLEKADESSLMNEFINGHNPIDRLKRKVKELEEERDSLKFQLNENEEKMMVLNKKLKEVKLQRDWENVKFNRVVIKSDSPSPPRLSSTPSPSRLSFTPSSPMLTSSPSPPRLTASPSPLRSTASPSPPKLTASPSSPRSTSTPILVR
ncbi:hypothetical protein H5410_038878 [Solanum commersonii]|uniref:GRF-type domain-containing protein n=1 Tax=Solanum commersonii TaxID=4109 RepID=A0A9J5YF45_SOLCO|nr:hypothetical protein H5410_038878 [Solanum commersonii]